MKNMILFLFIIYFNILNLSAEHTLSSSNKYKVIQFYSGSLYRDTLMDVKLPSKTYLIESGKKPIRIEPNNEIVIHEAQVHDRGIIAGVYNQTGDYYYTVRLFVFDLTTKKFSEISPPCPYDWEIENAEILGIRENGDVFYYLFLDRKHTLAENEKNKSGFAKLFKQESINCLYNLRNKNFTYFLEINEKPEVYVSKNNFTFTKIDTFEIVEYIKKYYPLFYNCDNDTKVYYNCTSINEEGQIIGWALKKICNEFHTCSIQDNGNFIWDPITGQFFWQDSQSKNINE